MVKKKSKKWILEHYECEGQLSIDDLPFTDKNVDNSLTDVDNTYEPKCTIYECVHCSLSRYCFPIND